MRSFLRFLSPFLLASSFALVGCGGGGGSSSGDSPDPQNTVPETYSVSGKVIDGYVSGATVWLDINGNGRYDASEPSAVSTSAGAYALELTENERACLPYADLYVDVPVGALDEELGTVSEAYQMVRPASLSSISDDDAINISPLTSVLFDEIHAVLADNDVDTASCETLLQDVALQQTIIARLDEAIDNVVDRYNLSEQTIYSDFVSGGDAVAHRLAQSIVTGLKATFANRDAVEQHYPDAEHIRLEFFQGSEIDNNGAYPEAWYRSIAVWLPNGFKSELVKMSDDLTTVVRPIYLRSSGEWPWGGGTLALTWDVYSYGGDGSGYNCYNGEKVSVTRDGIIYSLDNGGGIMTNVDVTSCVYESFGNGDYRDFEVDYVENGIDYYARFTVNRSNAGFSALPDWRELQHQSQPKDFDELVGYIEDNLEYRFDEPVANTDFYSWHKRSTDDTGAARVQIDHYSTGRWERRSYFEFGGYVLACSNDGQDWTADCY